MKTANLLLAAGMPLLLAPLPAAPAVHHCTSAEGAPLYVQFGCPPGTTPAGGGPAEEAGVFSVVSTPGISAEEARALAELETTLAREARQRARLREARDRSRDRQRALRRESCAEATSALARIADSRRKGYSAAEDRRFEAEEARWREARRAHC